MNPTRIPTWALGRLCGAVLTAAALALVAPAADAGSLSKYHVASRGNERVRAYDYAYGQVLRNSSYASARLSQTFLAGVDANPWERGFYFAARVNHFRGVGYAHVSLYVMDEQVLPPVHGNEFTLQGAYPGEGVPLPHRESFNFSAGKTSVAVGNQAYDLDVNWYVRLEFDLAGRARSLSDTAMSGHLDTRAFHTFRIDLPENIVLENASVYPPWQGSDLPQHYYVSPDRESRLSCNLRTGSSMLWGNWCRFQQDAWELKARLIRTTKLGSLTFTQVIPVVEDEIPAVDTYLIDKRFRLVAVPSFRW